MEDRGGQSSGKERRIAIVRGAQITAGIELARANAERKQAWAAWIHWCDEADRIIALKGDLALTIANIERDL